MHKKVIAGIAMLALLIGVYIFPISTEDTQVSAANADYFLKIEGVPGESTSKGHENEIEILAWSWGVSNSGSAHTGGGMGAGKANFQDISITKAIDKATPQLMQSCALGKHFPNAILTTRNERGQDMLRIRLDDVMCTSLQESASNGQAASESVTLNYSKIQVEYLLTRGGTPASAGWDVRANRSTSADVQSQPVQIQAATTTATSTATTTTQ